MRSHARKLMGFFMRSYDCLPDPPARISRSTGDCLRMRPGTRRRRCLPGKICPAIGKTGLVDFSGFPESKTVNDSSPETRAFSRTEPSRCEVCPLSHVKAGVAVRIKQLCAAPEVQNRLREIGLGEDRIVKLLTSQANFICQVCNARLAISAQLAQLILVEPVVVRTSA